MGFRKKIKEYTQAPLSHQLVKEALSTYNRPNDKISELVKNRELLALRRGLYVAGPESDLPVPHSFLIANHLRGPSYVSLESALSYWGMIPELVHEVSSATLKTTKTYTNDLGTFSYQYLPSPYYSFGVQQEELAPQQVALIASREKALCDKIVLTTGVNLRSITQTKEFLFEDLRIDEYEVSELSTSIIQTWLADAPKKNSLQMLIKTLDAL